jgi:hypothetical protein
MIWDREYITKTVVDVLFPLKSAFKEGRGISWEFLKMQEKSLRAHCIFLHLSPGKVEQLRNPYHIHFQEVEGKHIPFLLQKQVSSSHGVSQMPFGSHSYAYFSSHCEFRKSSSHNL